MSFSGSSGIDRCFQIGCVFVEYDLFNTTNLIQNLTYIRFGIILTQFYCAVYTNPFYLMVDFQPRGKFIYFVTPSLNDNFNIVFLFHKFTRVM